MEIKKIFFYSFYTDTICSNKKPLHTIGGAEVQMSFWTKAFANRLKTYTYSIHPNRIFNKKEWNINFCYFPLKHLVMVVLARLRPFVLFFVRPDYVVLRSAPYEINTILKLRNRLKFKLVFMVASDMDVIPNYSGWNQNIPKAISIADYVIAQNDFQYKEAIETLKAKRVIKQHNIWNKSLFEDKSGEKLYDYIWVGNLREVKRPEWLLEISKSNPGKQFAMIGAVMEQKYGVAFAEEMKKVPNLKYYGFKMLQDTTSLVSQSKCLLCTSIKEGFPNTFLQAFSYGIPVVSTVDPDGMIIKNNLGFIVSSLDEFNEIIKGNKTDSIDEENIIKFFNERFSVEAGLDNFIDFLSE